MTRIRNSAPVDPNDRFAQQIKDLLRRVADLERRSAPWQTITLASPNYTIGRTPEWRRSGGRIELRGTVTRTTSSFGAGGTLFGLTGGNPPAPSQAYTVLGQATIAAATPDSQAFTWVVDPSTNVFRSSGVGYTIAVGDGVSLDGIWWPS